VRFPVTIRHRSSKAKIYAPGGKFAYYRVAYAVAGKRRMQTFADVLERIEQCRNEPPVFFVLRQEKKPWEDSARALPAFPRRADTPKKDGPSKLLADDEKRAAGKQWRAVADKVLEDDFQNPEQAKAYRRLMASNQRKMSDISSAKSVTNYRNSGTRSAR